MSHIGRPHQVLFYALLISAASGQVYRIGEGVLAPRVIERIEPEYTTEAREAGIQGTVILSVEVTQEGKAENLVVVKSLKGLDDKAVEAVRKWKFAPGQKDGKPVRVRAQLEIPFRLPPKVAN